MQISIRVLVAVVLISGFNLCYSDVAYADITIDGETVQVETDGYVVQFDKGIITYIHNKHTGQTYTVSSVEGTSGRTGMLFNRYFWEAGNISTSWAELISATQIDPHSVELLFRHEGTDIRLSIAVDPMTDDLLINMEGVSDTRGVVGMQWGISYLDIQNLSVIIPKDGGRIFDGASPAIYHDYSYPGTDWEAQLAIVQGERGGFYVRNTDNTLQFKRLIGDRPDDGLALNFGTYNQAPFDSHTSGHSTMWRFNTYAGGWRVPARIYRDWMEQAFQPRRLSDIPWTEDITLVVGLPPDQFPMLHRLAELVDPTKTLILLGSWAEGAEWWSEELHAHMPDFIPKPEMGAFMEAAHQHGFRVILFTIMLGFSPAHPLYPHFRQYQYRDTWTEEIIENPPPSHPGERLVETISPASSEYRNLLVERLKPVWEEYGVDGFFIDATHYIINDGNGLIDGLNMAQGLALLHKDLAETMPGIVLGGERLHEASFAYESFAQRPLLLGSIAKPHPISTFLFSPFVHAIGYQPPVPDDDLDLHRQVLRHSEIWDVIPTLDIWPEHLDEQFVEVHKLFELARTWQHEYGLNADVNGDGVVNILDLTLVGQNVGVPFALPQADVDGDGLVNILDLIMVSNMFER